MDDIHIGRIIAARLKEIGMSQAELGRRIGLSSQGVNGLLKRPSADCGVLLRIGRVLDCNLFAPYVEELEGKRPDFELRIRIEINEEKKP